MVDGIAREVVKLTFRFEHDQASNVSYDNLLQEIQNLRNKQSEIEEHMKELLDYLTDFFLE